MCQTSRPTSLQRSFAVTCKSHSTRFARPISLLYVAFLFALFSVLFSAFFGLFWSFLVFFILSRAFLLTLPKVTVDKRAGWWLGDRKSAAFDAAKQAIRKVWGVEPMLIREGGTIPVTCLLEEVRRFSFFFVMADVQSDVQCASAASAARTKERLCAFGQ